MRARGPFVDAVFDGVLDSRKFLVEMKLPDLWALLELPPGGGASRLTWDGVPTTT